MTRPPPRWLTVVALVLPLGCAIFGQMKRDARLRDQLDAHAFTRPLDAVWPEALRLLSERHYDLIGKDRAVVGLPEQGMLGRLFAKGFETRYLGGGRRVLETNLDDKMRRYRVTGTDTGNGTCRVVFELVQSSSDVPTETEARDLSMELALVDRIEPDVAQRIAAAVGEQR